jgi:hypothetical protein
MLSVTIRFRRALTHSFPYQVQTAGDLQRMLSALLHCAKMQVGESAVDDALCRLGWERRKP